MTPAADLALDALRSAASPAYTITCLRVAGQLDMWGYVLPERGGGAAGWRTYEDAEAAARARIARMERV